MPKMKLCDCCCCLGEASAFGVITMDGRPYWLCATCFGSLTKWWLAGVPKGVMSDHEEQAQGEGNNQADEAEEGQGVRLLTEGGEG